MLSPNAVRAVRVPTALALALLTFLAGLTTASPASAATTTQLAASVLTSVNSIRRANHVPPLKVDSRLTLRADQHAALIAGRKQLLEIFPGEASLAARVATTGYNAAATAVTVGWSGTQAGLTQLPSVFASPRHASLRARMLTAGFTNIGVAVRVSTNPTRYVVTIIYARPLPAAQVYANAVLAQLNKQRAANHLPALRMNAALVRSAHSHNLAMAARNTMSHQLPGEASFGTRIDRAGYHYRYAGENIGYTTAMTSAGALSLQSLMYNERPPNDGHRRNILSRNYTEVGIDVVLDAAHHRLWLTQDFGSR